MPELPDISIYLEAMESRVVGKVLEEIRIIDAFVLCPAMPLIPSLVGKRLVGLRRLGKRILFHFEGDQWLVLHLMIAGRARSTRPRNERECRSNRTTVRRFTPRKIAGSFSV